jgi:hypothetical protein
MSKGRQQQVAGGRGRVGLSKRWGHQKRTVPGSPLVFTCRNRNKFHIPRISRPIHARASHTTEQSLHFLPIVLSDLLPADHGKLQARFAAHIDLSTACLPSCHPGTGQYNILMFHIISKDKYSIRILVRPLCPAPLARYRTPRRSPGDLPAVRLPAPAQLECKCLRT